MRRVVLLLAVALAFPAAAQEKKPARKPGARPPAHAKPTPQQIRRFNELEKKEQAQEKRQRQKEKKK